MTLETHAYAHLLRAHAPIDACVVLYKMTDLSSWSVMRDWWRAGHDARLPTVLCGTHLDQEAHRQVSEESVARERQPTLTVSARTGENCAELLRTLVTLVHASKQPDTPTRARTRMPHKDKDRKKQKSKDKDMDKGKGKSKGKGKEKVKKKSRRDETYEHTTMPPTSTAHAQSAPGSARPEKTRSRRTRVPTYTGARTQAETAEVGFLPATPTPAQPRVKRLHETRATRAPALPSAVEMSETTSVPTRLGELGMHLDERLLTPTSRSMEHIIERKRQRHSVSPHTTPRTPTRALAPSTPPRTPTPARERTPSAPESPDAAPTSARVERSFSRARELRGVVQPMQTPSPMLSATPTTVEQLQRNLSARRSKREVRTTSTQTRSTATQRSRRKGIDGWG